jgi:hypothetical protein
MSAVYRLLIDVGRTNDASSSNISVIAGAIAGGVAVSALFLAVLFRKKLLHRRRTKQQDTPREKIEEDTDEMTRVHQPFVLGLGYSSSSSIGMTSTISSNTDLRPPTDVASHYLHVNEWAPYTVRSSKAAMRQEELMNQIREREQIPRYVASSASSQNLTIDGEWESSLSTPYSVRSSKAAMRQEELMNQIREKEHSPRYTAPSVVSENPSIDVEVMELRRQVEDLWTQKQHLLEQLASVPSPEYHA